MTARQARWVPWTLTVLMLAVATLLPSSMPGEPGQGWGFFLLLTAQSLTFATVGLVLVGAQPGNSVSWLFVGVGVGVALYLVTERYQHYALEVRDGLPLGEGAAWLQTWLYVPSLGVVTTLLPLLFPTGRLLSRRWVPALVFALIASLGILLSDALTPGVMSQTNVVNPVGIAPDAHRWLSTASGLGLVAAALVGFAALVARWRSARHAERQQLKWFAYFALLIPLFVVANAAVNLLGVDEPYRTTISLVAGTGAFLGLPVGVAVSILRFQLYDVDLVIKRTVVYAALTATLVTAYLASVLLLRVALSPLTGRSDLAVAGSTLAVAALFRPLRARFQRLVDRRFFRPRYDAQLTVEEFAVRLRDELDVAAMSGDLRAMVYRTMRPSHVSLWLPPTEGSS
ncbi:MAG: hypothetical protein ACRDO4_09920 [Nocardioides sp.]